MKTLNRPLKLNGSKKIVNSITIQVLQYDIDGKILLCTGLTVPTADSTGFAKGCLFIKTNAADGTKGLYENIGLSTASDFNLIGDVAASEIGLAEGSLLVGNSSGVATALVAKTSGRILVGNGTTSVLVAVSGDATLSSAGAVTVANDAITTVKILNSNVTLAKLAAGITPSHVVKYAGKITWTGSGATLASTVSGVLSTDVVMVTIQGKPTQAAYLVGAVPTTDTITFELSAANTSNDAVIAYQVLRAAA